MGLLTEACFESGLRWSFKFLIDEAILPKNHVHLLVILSLLGGGIIVLSLICLISDYLWALFGARVLNDIRRTLFDHIQGLSAEFFSRYPGGDLLNRFLSDATTIENSLVSALPAGLLGISTILLSGTLLFSLDWRLSSLGYLGLTICFLAPRSLSHRAAQETYHLRQREGMMASLLQETLEAHSVVRLFGLERMQSRRFATEMGRFMQTAIRANFLVYLSQRIPYLVFTLCSLVILGTGAAMTYLGWISIGTLISYQILFLGLSSSISNLTWVMPALIDGASGMRRIQEILSEVPQVQDKPGAMALPRLSQEIRFEQVSFRYMADRAGLQQISFRLKQGKFSVFVGPSGSGKSTILQLLARFYDPQTGRILVDGLDLREVTQASLRRQIGFVSQEVLLFNQSVRENIRLGDLTASDWQVEAAAKAAEIHDFILSLPQGYDTPIGEKGGQLSGGQRQRIALARALVRDPAILILDEATSALDPLAEAEILKTLSRLAQSHTILSVTHRLQQALYADEIFVLHQGVLVAQGQHSTLLHQGGLYAALWQQ